MNVYLKEYPPHPILIFATKSNFFQSVTPIMCQTYRIWTYIPILHYALTDCHKKLSLFVLRGSDKEMQFYNIDT